jgi:chemotaxis family two-component system sensor kinase Cph1
VSFDIDAALANCSREPIHIPGAIQPFGVLIALDPAERCVEYCSANTAAAFGVDPQGVLGVNPIELLGADLLRDAPSGDFEAHEPVRIALSKGSNWDAFVHRHCGRSIVELEQVDAESAETGRWLNSNLRRAISALDSARSVAELSQRACEEVRKLTGFDGVMVYKFHADGHGEVIAESKADEFAKYLGLHYPASDIPLQARDVLEQLGAHDSGSRLHTRAAARRTGRRRTARSRPLAVTTWGLRLRSLCRLSTRASCGV